METDPWNIQIVKMLITTKHQITDVKAGFMWWQLKMVTFLGLLWLRTVVSLDAKGSLGNLPLAASASRPHQSASAGHAVDKRGHASALSCQPVLPETSEKYCSKLAHYFQDGKCCLHASERRKKTHEDLVFFLQLSFSNFQIPRNIDYITLTAFYKHSKHI